MLIDVLKRLMAQQSLGRTEARAVISTMTEGTVPPSLAGAVLAARGTARSRAAGSGAGGGGEGVRDDTWSERLKRLVRRASAARTAAGAVAERRAEGAVPPSRGGAAVAAWASSGEPAEELTGAAEALR